jgi:hypothetical protein
MIISKWLRNWILTVNMKKVFKHMSLAWFNPSEFFYILSQEWWYLPVMTATQEVEIGESPV